ncbi:DUF6792 domain-containing protein [Terribacillus saccharophilus]|uniref:DUF6792 domain-containing protein n=1 Tax=Terribacillus saccharophilus TaxID=361277 RepID=UPI003981E28C
MSLDKITSSNIWLRLVNSEYDNLVSNDLETKFKSIYLEEAGELFEGNVEIYHSSDSNHVSVVEVIEPLQNADLDEQIHDLKVNVESGYTLIESYREAVEKLFKEEENLSQMFALVRGKIRLWQVYLQKL